MLKNSNTLHSCGWQKDEVIRSKETININIQIQVSALYCVRTKSIIYSAYLAMKLWFYRRLKGKKAKQEEQISI
jgi:hypothetical protein